MQSPTSVREQSQAPAQAGAVQLGSNLEVLVGHPFKGPCGKKSNSILCCSGGVYGQQGHGGDPSSLHSTQSPVQASPAQYSCIYSGFTETSPVQATAVLKSPEYLSHTERLRELRLFSWRKRRLREISSLSINTWTDSCQQTRQL